jgi:MarR family transcriptional regulator for hemolysin
MDASDLKLMQLTMTLTQASRIYIAAANKLAAEFGLTHATAWPIIIINRHGDGVRPGIIAETLLLEPASLVRVIDQLVDAQLVERKEDPHDRRAKILRLTENGRMRAEQLEAALVPFRRTFFSHIPESDIDASLRTLLAIKSDAHLTK